MAEEKFQICEPTKSKERLIKQEVNKRLNVFLDEVKDQANEVRNGAIGRKMRDLNCDKFSFVEDVEQYQNQKSIMKKLASPVYAQHHPRKKVQEKIHKNYEQNQPNVQSKKVHIAQKVGPDNYVEENML